MLISRMFALMKLYKHPIGQGTTAGTQNVSASICYLPQLQLLLVAAME